MKSKDTTNYSEKIKGDARNGNVASMFDVTDGYVGIQQYESASKISDRVLLSPRQWAALVEFVKNNA